MAGHAQLKFVVTECSKTQIRLKGPHWRLVALTNAIKNIDDYTNIVSSMNNTLPGPAFSIAISQVNEY